MAEFQITKHFEVTLGVSIPDHFSAEEKRKALAEFMEKMQPTVEDFLGAIYYQKNDDGSLTEIATVQ
jgi:hypothetical protein